MTTKYRIRLKDLYVSFYWQQTETRFCVSVSTNSDGCNVFRTREEAQDFCNRFVAGGWQYKGTPDAGHFRVEEVVYGE